MQGGYVVCVQLVGQKVLCQILQEFFGSNRQTFFISWQRKKQKCEKIVFNMSLLFLPSKGLACLSFLIDV